MAMSSMSTTINNTTFQSLVKCPICLDYYDDPRVLPCSHTFCFQCLENLCKNGNAQCPMRDNMIIYRHMIKQLPINRIAQDLVDCINKSSESILSRLQTKCDHCKKILSEYICQTCSKKFCTICLKLDHDINQFKTHQIYIIIDENSTNLCPEHSEEKLKYWCTRCEEIVCSDCLLFKHKQHSFITIESIAQETKIQLNSSIQEILEMKQNLEKLNKNTDEVYLSHYDTHIKTKRRIEQFINNLQQILEERKNYLIKKITEKDVDQQNIIRKQKTNIEEHLKIILIRELFTKQFLTIENPFQLVQMKNNLINYNQLITQQYQQLIQGFIFDVQKFSIENSLANIQENLQDIGDILTETFLIDCNHIHPLIKLSDISSQEKYFRLKETYAYGYRFHLTKPLQIKALRVKAALFDSDLVIYILDHNDILIQKEIIESNDQNSSTLKWININCNYQIQHNYCIFIWTQSNGETAPLIAYRDSTHNLRQINEHISIRSKRAQMNKSTNIDINTKFNVLYDALSNSDEKEEATIPAIEMILDI